MSAQVILIIKTIFVISTGGSIGGIAIGILNKTDHHIRLPGGKTLSLGFFGDALIGSTASLALFSIIGSLFNIEMADIGKLDVFIKIFAISILGGFSGIALLKLLSSKLLDQVKNQLAEVDMKVTSLEDIQLSEEQREMGRYVALKGGYSSALVHYEEALKINPKNKEALLNKASALKDSGKVEEALKIVKTALDLDPIYARAFYNRSCYKALLSKPIKEVLDDLNKAISLQIVFKKLAIKEDDFESVKDDEEFKNVIG